MCELICLGECVCDVCVTECDLFFILCEVMSKTVNCVFTLNTNNKQNSSY